jgi:2-C-methyl-D-erythritol 4-phosphate cytidylyltransferase
VPAGGTGSRVGAGLPKQYLDLAGRPLLLWTLEALEALAPRAIVVVVAPGDDRAAALGALPDGVELLPRGGATRAASVLAGLDALASRAGADDWVMVHDAARPCVDPGRVRVLLERVASHQDGGLLAEPVAETVKEGAPLGGDAAAVCGTLDREALWLAQTPQVFRFGALHAALADALAAGAEITDEASAMERAGARPLLVPGGRSNIKVTRPDDVALAEFWLATRRREGEGA